MQNYFMELSAAVRELSC